MEQESGRFSSFSQSLNLVVGNLARTGRGRKQAVSIVVDASIAFFSLWVAFSLRASSASATEFGATHVYIVVPLATVLIFGGLGIYRWVVRSINRRLYNQLIKGCLLSSLVMMGVMYLFPVGMGNPRSVIVVFALLLIIGTVSARFLWHGLFDTAHQGEPIAVYGAGSAGQHLVALLSLASDYRPMLFLDDNPALYESTVSGLRVVNGQHRQLADILARQEVTRIILAMPGAGAHEYREIYERLAPLGIHTQTVPGFAEIMSGQASYDQIRDVSITDILGRDEVAPDPSLLGHCVQGKVVLVTGGGGSIGSEMCRQIAVLNPHKLIVMDNAETNLYQVSESLAALLRKHELPASVFEPVLCSVNDTDGLKSLFVQHRIDTVFHAAAYKHVPIVEAQPEQGVTVNVFGTRNVLDMAIDHRCQHFILISTDKAVRPTNAMGASKRVAELILQARHRDEDNRTCIAMVRFGNVLGSSGSVVPKFRQQIKAGGPITLTDRRITRYFMTIPEAAQLVLQASSVAQGGEVFVLDMGEPVRIYDLAETMVRLYGKRLQRETGNEDDIDIQIVGLRPGEKLYEEMFITDSHRKTHVPKVWTADEDWMPWSELEPQVQLLWERVKRRDREALRAQLLALANPEPAASPVKQPADPSVSSLSRQPAVTEESVLEPTTA